MFGPEDEKNYADMIKDGWEMSADGFWFKETPSENYTTTISDNPKLGCYKQTYADGSVRYTMTEEPDDYLFNLNMQSKDKIDLNFDTTNKNGFWKYNEDKILKQLEEYISSTYSQHYVDRTGGGTEQTLDKIKHNRREGFCAGNVTKYIDRYDTKGTPRADLFKVLHYTILLINHLNLVENK
jgi:hypothetical protein